MPLTVGEDKAVVTNPQPTCNNVVKLVLESKSILTALIVFVILLSILTGVLFDIADHFLFVKVKKVVVFFKGQDYLGSVVVPVYILRRRRHVDASYMHLCFPVIKSHEFFAFNCQQPSSVYAFHLKPNLEYFKLLHIFENLDFVVFTLDGENVLIRINCSPYEVRTTSECRILKLRVGVDYEVIVSTN